MKVINAGTSSGYLVKNWDVSTTFSSYSEMEDQIASDFATLLQEDGSLDTSIVAMV